MAFGLSALNGIEWQRTPKECLITGALPFSECNERMSFIVIQRPTGANAILPLPTTQKMGIEFDTHLLLVL